MTWMEYVRRHTTSTVQTVIGGVMGVDQTRVSAWIRDGDVPAPATAIRIARHLGVAPAEVLLAAGHITAEEAQAQVTHVQVTEPTDRQLLDMLGERLRKAGGSGGDTPAKTDAAGGPGGVISTTRGRGLGPGGGEPGRSAAKGPQSTGQDGRG